MATAYIGLGSNLGDRERNLREAVRRLTAHCPLRVLATSTILETDPVDFLDQPRFMNMVVRIETTLTPHELLHCLKKSERELGRKKTFSKGPRTIDLDILLYDNIILNTEDLTIPHPEIKNREFVMRHLIELDPELVDPLTGAKYRSE